MSGSWEHVADWWDDQVGEDGDFTHQHLIFPGLMNALGDVYGRTIADLGCGNGTTTRGLARAGAKVTGVDISPAMIERARGWERKRPLGIEYVVSDATNVPSLTSAGFDRVTANMVLMDLEDGAGLFGEASRLLRPGGRFVISLCHPCFEINGGSGWSHEWTDFDSRLSKLVWRYRDVFEAPGVAKLDQPEPIVNYHRPLNWYAARLVERGLLIDCLDEPIPDEIFAREKPDFYHRIEVVPFVIVIGATKLE